MATTTATAVARRRQECGQRAVFVKTEQQRKDDGQATTAKYVGTENPVFRAEYK